MHLNKGFYFSQIEIKELVKAWIAISIAFAIILSYREMSFINLILLSGFTVGIGFLLHEMAHKYVAQKYNCWAEFRADNTMLLIMLLMSFTGFLFAAPGAVMIQGNITKRRNGIISLAGPATNMVLGILFLAIFFLTPFKALGLFGAQVNIFIGLFNLLPFGNIDGKKIIDWDKKAYFTTLSIGILLLLLVFF